MHLAVMLCIMLCVKLCTLPKLGAIANNSITGLHTIPHYNHSDCNSDCYVRMFKKKGCEVVLCEGL